MTDVNGQYVLQLTRGAGIPRGTYGAIRFDISQNLELEATWLAPKLIVDVTSGFSGTAPAGRGVSFDFLDGQGEILDSRSELVAGDNIGGSVRGYAIDLSRLGGGHLRLERGDEIRAMIGDDDVSTRVAELSAHVSPRDDTVSGWTEPHRQVNIGIQKRTKSDAIDRKVVSTQSDEKGEFSADFGSIFDITFANEIDISSIDPDGHVTVMYFHSPMLQIDLDSSVVSGSISPNDTAEVVVTRDGLRISVSSSRADELGRFSVRLAQVDGSLLPLVLSDVVSVVEATGGMELKATIPAFTLRVAPETQVLTGVAAPNANVEFYARAAFVGSGGTGAGRARAAADGTFEYSIPAENRGGWDATPGTIVEAVQHTIEEHLVTRSWRNPIISAESNGARMCGAADPATNVHVDILNASGELVASAEGHPDWAGYWEAIVRDRVGLPFAIGPTHTVKMSVDNQSENAIALGLSVKPDWVVADKHSGISLTVLRGSTTPSTAYQMFGGSDGCFTGRVIPFGVTVIEGNSSADGHFVEQLIPHQPGMATLVTTSGISGLRSFIDARRGLLTVHKGTARFEALGMPGTPITVTLSSGDGSRVVEYNGRLDALGHLNAKIQDSRSEIVFATNDRIVAEFGDDSSEFIVSDFDFDFDASGVIVTAKRDDMLLVVFTLSDGSEIRLSRRVGPDGRARIGSEAIFRRTDWRAEDITSVSVMHVTSSGHMVAITAQPGSHRPTSSVYLPFAKLQRTR